MWGKRGSLRLDVQAFQESRLRVDCRQAPGTASWRPRLQCKRNRGRVRYLRNAHGQGAPETGSQVHCGGKARFEWGDRKSTRLNSSHSQISYAVFCLKKKTN